MSRRKQTYVSVEDQELRRLHEAQRRLRAVENNVPDLIDATQRVNRREIERAFNSAVQRQQASQRQIEQRIQALQATDRSLSQQQQAIRRRVTDVLRQVQENERRTEQRMVQQRQELLTRLDSTANQVRQEAHGLVSALRDETSDQMGQQRQELIGRIERTAGQLRRETNQLLREQDQRLRSAVEQERRAREEAVNNLQNALEQEQRERRAQIQDLQQRTAAFEQKEVDQRELAAALIEEAVKERQLIERTYRPEQFAPGVVAKLDQVLRNAQANLQGAPQAALAHAENAYNGMVDLRQELRALEAAWDLARAQALAACGEVLETAARNRKCQACVLDEQSQPTPLDIMIEVDHWTEGGLTRLEEDVKRLRESLASESLSLSTEELEEVAQQKAAEWRECLDNLTLEARLAALGAQRRTDIAEIAVEALVDQGFEFEGDAYEAKDDRRTFQANVVDRANNKVVVRVSPVEGHALDNEVELISYDADPEQRTPIELLERARDVGAALRERGVPVPDLEEVVGEEPNPAWAELEQVRRTRARPQSSRSRAQTG